MATAAKIPPAPTWDLDSIFPGGSKSAEFKNHRAKVKKDLDELKKMLASLPSSIDDGSLQQWTDFILKLQAAAEATEFVISFSGCLSSQDVTDTEADGILAEGYLYWSQWEKLSTEFDALALAQTDEAWERLVTSQELQEIRFYLDERRTIARSKMPVELESLALDLAVNGYHAWNQLYDKMAGELMVDFEQEGKTERISMGQLATKFSDPNRDVRRQAFEKMTEGWQSRADLAAMTLNAQAGFRLSLYANRKWDSPLREPLFFARVRQYSLEALW